MVMPEVEVGVALGLPGTLARPEPEIAESEETLLLVRIKDVAPVPSMQQADSVKAAATEGCS